MKYFFLLLAIVLQFSTANAQETSRVALLYTGRVQLQAKLDLILQAKQEVQLSTYIYKSDNVGNWILWALGQASKNTNGNVRLLADKIGTWVNFGFVKLILEQGVQFAYFEARFKDYKTSFNKRMHDKLVVSDRKEVVLGSSNIVSSYDLYNDLPHERDAYASGHPGEVAGLHFDRAWTDSRTAHYSLDPSCKDCLIVTREKYDKKTKARTTYQETVKVDLKQYEEARAEFQKQTEALMNEKALVLADSKREWMSNPEDSFDIPVENVHFIYDDLEKLGKPSRSTFALATMIERARSQLLIENSYVILSHEIRKALEKQRKAARDSEFRIFTNSGRSTDEGMAQIAYEIWSNELRDLGARIYEQIEGHTLHSKCMVVDNEWSYIGAYNLDPRSRNLNSETGLIIQDKRFANRLTQMIERRLETGAEEVIDGKVASGKSRHPDRPFKEDFVRFWKKVLIFLVKPQI